MSPLNIGYVSLTIDLILGAGPEPENIFKYPYSLAVDRNGRIYVADRGNKRIQVFNSKGLFQVTIGGPRSRFVKLTYPRAIALDRDGRIFIGDTFMSKSWIIRLNEDLRFEKKLKMSYYAAQIGLTDKAIIVGLKDRRSSSNAHIIDYEGRTITTIDPVARDTILWKSRVNVVMSPSGNVFMAHEFLPRVRKFSPQGDLLLDFTFKPLTKNYKEPETGIFGNIRNDGVHQLLCYDIAVDLNGFIYLLISTVFTENELCSLYQFDSSGLLLRTAELPFPCGRLFIDHAGNFYFLSQMVTGLLYKYRSTYKGKHDGER